MEQQLSVLIVEDEPKIRVGLKDFLEFHNYLVTEAVDGLTADDLVARRRFDIILLDLMLPKISGEELCTRWRQNGLCTPIIMLTAKGREKEKIAGLDLGADDYITKPFSLEELQARIQAVLRRSRPDRSVGRDFPFGSWQVNLAELKINAGDTQQAISPREGQLLQYFAAHPQRIISRDELYEKIWCEPISELETRTVDMHIAKLRSKIEQDSAQPRWITTVRGAGYRYEK